ncbi:MAG: energy transducer TonB [Flavobacterium sp.]|nr:energy transducer TonB [Flavobacterium sp.]
MVQFTQIEHKKESLIITSAIFVMLFILLYFLSGSISQINDLEGGGGGGDIAVNFGDSDVGSGDNFQSRESAPAAAQVKTPEKAEEEEIITNQSDNDVPAVVTTKPKTEPKKEVVKPIIVPPKPKASQATNDALASVLNSSNSKGGDGDDKTGGNKGKANGDTNATGYSGGGGTGTGSGGGNGSGQGIGTGSGYGAGNGGGNGNGSGNWKLAGRKLASSSKQVQKCNEYGVVVVQITVNRSGNVIGTKYIKGTTNTDPCLLEPAYATARTYKWEPKPDAAETQIGTITINFKLGE